MPDQSTPPWVFQARKRVGYRVRALREERGLTQEQLSALTGIDRKTINRIERASYGTSIDKLLLIARALRVPPGALFT